MSLFTFECSLDVSQTVVTFDGRRAESAPRFVANRDLRVRRGPAEAGAKGA